MSVNSQRTNRWRVVGWSAAALILLTPLIAMQFTDEVAWDPSDFVFMGILLAGAGTAIELASRKTGSATYRWGVGIAVAAGFLLFWVNAAVGIIGSEDNDINMLFYSVHAVAMVGALLVRFEAKGMARAMIAAAIAQGVVFAIAWIGGWGFTGPLTFFFVAMWVGSAQLFAKAAQKNAQTAAP